MIPDHAAMKLKDVEEMLRRDGEKMPLYDFQCKRCLGEQQVLQKYTDPPPTCEKCASNAFVERKMSVTSFELKGKGWASDGYSSSGKKK